MNTLTRWNPMREMMTMQNLMDRMFEGSVSDMPALWSQSREDFVPALDVMENDDAYIVKASIPGVEPDAVDITLTDNVLTIKGQTQQEHESDEQNYHVRERRFGSFSRSISLPTSIEADSVEASHENGTLTLHLPKAETAKPKRIAIKATVDG